MIIDLRTMIPVEFFVTDYQGNPVIAVLIYQGDRVVTAYAGRQL
jgi:hypothetical protein